MGMNVGEAVTALSGCLAAAGAKTAGASLRDRLEALAVARLAFFDEGRERWGAAEEEALAEPPFRSGVAVSPFLAAGAHALQPLVEESFIAARAAGARPALDEAEACLALWAMLESVILGVSRRGERQVLAARGSSAGLALALMLEELSGLDSMGFPRPP